MGHGNRQPEVEPLAHVEAEGSCAALGCEVADLLQAEPVAAAGAALETLKPAVGQGSQAGSGSRPVPRQPGTGPARRALPPN
ncbi:hypothetical protein GCM10023237_69220 [Streptomyces coeruleoprunus]